MFNSVSMRRHMRVAICLLAVGALGARADQGEYLVDREWPSAVEEILTGEPKPEDYAVPVTCLHFGAYTHVELIDGKLLLVRNGGEGAWLNPLPPDCFGLRESEVLVFKLRDSRLCEFDTVGGPQSTGERPAGIRCGLGAFYPVSPMQAELLTDGLSQPPARQQPTRPVVTAR